jgi:CheY-like chemotaxis protein
MTTPNPPTPPLDAELPHVPSVLVVDDESMIRRVAQLSLVSAGYTVGEAANAATAIDAVRAATVPFDLVVLDFTLPDADGTAVIPVIRQHAPHTRVLLMSGHGEMDAASLGADGYLAKPFTKTALISAIEQTLAR